MSGNKFLNEFYKYEEKDPIIHDRVRGFRSCKVFADGHQLNEELYPMVKAPYELFDEFVEAGIERLGGRGTVQIKCNGKIVESYPDKKYLSMRMKRWI